MTKWNLSSPAGPCPICEETQRSYMFVVRGLPIAACRGCGLVTLYPYPSEGDLKTYREAAAQGQGPPLQPLDSDTEREACRRYVAELRDRGLSAGRLLVVASPDHPFAAIAREEGFEVALHTTVADLATREAAGAPFDGAVILQELQAAAAPLDLLRKVHAALRPQGVLLVTAPSLDSWPANYLGHLWTEWRPENRYYFNRTTLHALLLKSGFGEVLVDPDRRLYTFKHVRDRAAGFRRTMLTRSIGLTYALTPGFLRRAHVRLATSAMIVTATRAEVRERPLLSIVVPVYNERDTAKTLLDALVQKTIPGIDREIVIVESNSTDGTREVVRPFGEMPGVRLVLEDRPRGKGMAVRTGFDHATGDIVLIQDADLEYDLNDYEGLLEPILQNRAMFVLGTRHAGHWKIRHFEGQWIRTHLANAAHMFFTGVLNVLYRQHLTDPHTMFKVLRRDCLYRLDFECRRFDFDFELVIKLILKGYRPIEVPVNYVARNFTEGKKIGIFRDPITWLWQEVKLRVVPLKRRPLSATPKPPEKSS